MKFFTLFIALLFITSAQAENVKLRFSAIDATIDLQDIAVTQVQTKLRCVFYDSKRGGFIVSRRYPFTQVIPGDQSVQIKIKKSSLTEWLTKRFKLESCAFVLITMGTDHEGKSRMGDIVLMGQLKGQMSERDLEWMQNKEDADIYLNKRLETMTLGMGQVRGKNRIVELP